MTDFRKWDKFDADAAEEEVERKVCACGVFFLCVVRGYAACAEESALPLPLSPSLPP